jgi:hypothetical protein
MKRRAARRLPERAALVAEDFSRPNAPRKIDRTDPKPGLGAKRVFKSISIGIDSRLNAGWHHIFIKESESA